jgi:cytoskeletal protein RodZ
VDIAGSSHAPILQIKRPTELVSGDTLTASISCASPWDVDDDDTDDSKVVSAGKVPAITYESSDLLWTLSIAVIMVAIAWLLGIVRPKRIRPPRKQTAKPTPTKKEEKDVEMTIEPDADDISLDEVSTTPEPEQTPPEEPEEEVIDIDDETASGRLSALRKEITTDGNTPVESSTVDLASRMDSFLKDR